MHSVIELGTNAGRGNLLGIQPCMSQQDYATEAQFCTKIDTYFVQAQRRGWLIERTIVVLPEYLGTWLVTLDAPASVVAASSLETAMQRLVLRRPFRFVQALARAWLRRGLWPRTERFDVIKDAVLRMNADRAARAYNRVFGGLARNYRVTIVAGSLALPAPRIVDGSVVPTDGPLQNVAAVFGPDGRAHPRLVRKLFPITDERSFTACGTLADLPVFNTPAGRLGVVICADSWYPAVYAALRTQGVELIAVPSFLAPAGVWSQPWQGYNGGAPPNDIDLHDIGAITEGAAWRKYALRGRIAASGARYGINCFLRGNLWGMSGDGATLGVADAVVAEAPLEAEDAFVNVWLA